MTYSEKLDYLAAATSAWLAAKRAGDRGAIRRTARVLAMWDRLCCRDDGHRPTDLEALETSEVTALVPLA